MNLTLSTINNTSFKAIPLAKYSYLKGTERDIFVYQLEKRDVGFLKDLLNNLENFYKKFEIQDISTTEILKEAVSASIKILQSKEEDKAKVLMAFADKEPSAILIGNILKKDKNGNLHYSSRKNHSKYETELDWLATWNKKILGEGKVIVSEFFHRVIKDGFKQVYVRSEVPELSFALEFYKKMGFAPLSEKQRRLQRKNDYSCLIGDNFHIPDDKIIPMKATIKDMKQNLEKRSKEMIREEIEYPCSVELSAKI